MYCQSAVTIRPAIEADQPTIRRLIKQANINRMDLRWLNFVVAEDGGAIVGVGQVKAHSDGSRELASIAVVPELQGRGIGGAIIKTLLAREGDRVLYLTCRRQLTVTTNGSDSTPSSESTTHPTSAA
jgi:ribosomal protein S18 acetylase RimI-like enzyme